MAATDDIIIEPGFRPHHREDAARGYWNAFSEKLTIPLGPREKALGFIVDNLNPSHAISAVNSHGAFLGVAGFKTDEGAFVGGDMMELRAAYGLFGSLWRGLLLSVLEREVEEDTLLMDGIFVGEAARGRGVGTRLLAGIVEKGNGLGKSSVRLDVIDENPRARALYERQGFEPKGRTELGPLRHVFGFSGATTMVKRL